MNPNPQQLEVINHRDGPCLVTAVPGSGKTASVTERVKRMVAAGVDPSSILAITFTNKAADEMRSRISKAVGAEAASKMVVSTFHSLCVRMIRANYDACGLKQGFGILDQDDQERMVKRCAREAMARLEAETRRQREQVERGLGKEPQAQPEDEGPETTSIPKEYLNGITQYIEGSRNSCMTESEAVDKYGITSDQLWAANRYFKSLEEFNCVDFTGMISKVLEMLEKNQAIREKYQRRWKYISVDEVQDTNVAQYLLIKQLAMGHKNILVVGDLDQCVPEDELVDTPSGKRRIGSIAPGNLVYGAGDSDGWNGTKMTGFVEDVVRNHYSGPLVIITTKSGFRSRTTPNHVLFGGANHIPFGKVINDTYPPKVVNVIMFGHWTLDMARPLHHVFVGNLSAEDVESLKDKGFDCLRNDNGCHSHSYVTKDYEDALAHAKKLASVNGMDVLYWAVLFEDGASREIQAGDFKPDMKIVVEKNGIITEDVVSKVETEEYDGYVCDLKVNNIHNFICNGVVCHNSIYMFRGAAPTNIMRFEKEFGAKVLKLETNYRSTPEILAPAQKLIEKNSLRMATKLKTTNAGGEGPRILAFPTEDDMARGIADDCQRRIDRGTPGREIAVFFRTNPSSRVLEQEFRHKNIPYKLVGGLSFYNRKEVKISLAILKLLANGLDRISFEKVCEACCKGVGPKTMASISEIASFNDLPILRAANEYAGKSGAKGHSIEQLVKAYGKCSPMSPSDALMTIAKDTGFYQAMQKESTTQNDRAGNIDEMARDVGDYVERRGNTLAGYLQNVLLQSDSDSPDEAGKVKLMSIHASKGLEFDVVFISHMTGDLLPHYRACNVEDPKERQYQIEEERRLLYVGMTRARKSLSLCYPMAKRGLKGKVISQAPSPFLYETGLPLPHSIPKKAPPIPGPANEDAEDRFSSIG